MKSIISVAKTFIACSILFASSSALAKMQVDNFDLVGPVPGGVCTTEDAWFTSGQLQIMILMRDDGNGGMHMVVREQLKGGSITDKNGATYRISGNVHEFINAFTSEQATSGGTIVIHDSWNIRVTPTKGSGGERFWLKGRLQVVVDSEGNPNIINARLEEACEG